jgi:hypothetical protein
MSTISEIDQQIAKLEAEKQSIIGAKINEILSGVEEGIKELNTLGHSCKLTVSSTASRRGSRRTGIRKQVLDTVKAAQKGINRADLLSKLDASHKSAQQSVSNALAALKKDGKIDAKDGVYTAG